jgi:imidazolonepropionase-like amidohydrolase
MGLEAEIGTIEPGKQADLVIARCDALDVVALRDSIEMVYQGGRRVV